MLGIPYDPKFSVAHAKLKSALGVIYSIYDDPKLSLRRFRSAEEYKFRQRRLQVLAIAFFALKINLHASKAHWLSRLILV